MAAGQIDLDRAARALGIARRGSIFSNGVLDDLDGKKEGTLCRGGVRVRRKPRVTQPFEDEVGVQRMAPSHLRHGNTRHRRLKTDRPLLLYGPEPLGSTRHPKANSVRYPKRTLSDAHWPWQGGVPGRLLRAIALGRKNYLFVGSEAGGKAAAIAYTLIETAKLNRVDPQAWLADTLARIPDYKITKVDELLPWRWTR